MEKEKQNYLTLPFFDIVNPGIMIYYYYNSKYSKKASGFKYKT